MANETQTRQQPQQQAQAPKAEQTPEQWLRAKGWEYRGKNGRERDMWADPEGSLEGPTKQVVRHLPAREDGIVKSVPLTQMVAPVQPWDFETRDAVQIQKARDFDKIVKEKHAPAIQEIADRLKSPDTDPKAVLAELREYMPEGCKQHSMFLELKRELCDKAQRAAYDQLLEANRRASGKGPGR